MLANQAISAIAVKGEKSGLLEMTSLDQQQISGADPISVNQFNNALFNTIKNEFSQLIDMGKHSAIVSNSIEFAKNPSGLNALKLQTLDNMYSQSSILVSKLVGLTVKGIDTLVRIQ